MQKYFTIVTDLGTELIAKAAQRGEKVNIVSIAAGDGNGSEYKPTSDMTALKREIWRGAIQNYEIDSVAKNVIKISGTIPKDVGHFVLREIALFDDHNNMIAICNAPDLLKAVLEEGALTEAVVYMRIALTNTEAVNIVVDSSAVYATARDLDAHKNDETAHQKLFDEKVDKTDFETSLNEVENTLQQKANKNDVDKALETKANINDVEASLATKVNTTVLTTELNKKVDKSDFTGTNIGSLLEAAGWQSGTIINNIVDGEKEGSIKQINANVTGKNAVAFGTSTASGELSHAEGEETIASGYASHAEGCGYGVASGENFYTIASGMGSHAEGGATVADGIYCHAEGYSTQASDNYCHAEGMRTTARGNYSHAEGAGTTADYGGHAEGEGTIASGNGSHAGGSFTEAMECQRVIGKFNVKKTGGRYEPNQDNTSGTAFIIGNGKTGASGSSPTKSNCFRVDYNGGTFAAAAYNSSGADYAEYFKWSDDNVKKEDRTGLFVTLEKENIRIANQNDKYILGIISATPAVVGNSYEDQWKGLYETDIYTRIVYEEIEVQGKKHKIPKINTAYDNTKKYIPRSQRPEWAAVGLLGQLVVIDDGSCKEGGFCIVANGGIATHSDDKGYYVMARLDESHIKILFR